MEEITIKNCNKNLKLVRETLNLSQAKLSQQLGISQQTYGHYETGKNAIPDKIKIKLLQIGVNLQWLLTGEGEMFLPAEEEQKAAEKPSLGYLEEVFIPREDLEEDLKELTGKAETQALRRDLEQSQKKLEALWRVVESKYPEEFEEPEAIREVMIPYLGFGGAAGPLKELDTIEDEIAVREDFLPKNRKEIFAVRIEGGSMIDIIPDGSNVLLRVCQEPISGRVYVFTLRGKATIKKFRLDHTGPHFEYMDGSGRSIYPSKGEQWYCNAEFLRVLG